MIIIKIIKKVVVTILLIYGLNLIISSLGIIIPLNIITIALVSLLGIPGLCTLVVLYLLI